MGRGGGGKASENSLQQELSGFKDTRLKQQEK